MSVRCQHMHICADYMVKCETCACNRPEMAQIRKTKPGCALEPESETFYRPRE